MGLFDRFRSKGETSKEETEETESGGVSGWSGVDVERRAGIIRDHYEGIDADQAEHIAELLAIGESENIGSFDVVDDTVDELGLDQLKAEEIVLTERHSFSVERDISQWKQFDTGRSLRWLGTDCVEGICGKVGELTEENPVDTPKELKGLLREAAENHPHGTPERVDHWVPHHECKATVLT